MNYFTRDEILMGREKAHPIPQEISDNLDALISALNIVRQAYGKSMIVSSGYRPAAINASVGGAANSTHQVCQAVDIVDKDGLFANWCMNNLTVLEKAGIFMEDPRYTMSVDKSGKRVSGWVHLQIRKPNSGSRVFIPYNEFKIKVV